MADLNGGTLALINRLSHFRAWLRWRDGWLMAQNTIWMAIFLAMLIELAGRFWPIAQTALWAAFPLAIWLVVCAFYGFLQPIPLMKAAQRVDKELRLKDKLSTAFFLTEHQTDSNNQSGFRPELVTLQEKDALLVAGKITSDQIRVWRWMPGPLGLALVLGVIWAVLAWMPNPMDDVLAQREALAEAMKAQAAQVEKMAEKLSQEPEADTLTPQEIQELKDQLEELAQKLRQNPGDQEQALADLSKMEEALRQKQDPAVDQRQAVLAALAEQMQALAAEKGWLKEKGNLEQELQKMAADWANLSASEQAGLEQSLSQLAVQAAQSGDQDLAQTLASLAQSLQASQASQQAGNNSSSSANGKTDDVMHTITQAQKYIAAQKNYQQILNQLQASRQAIAQAGSNPGRAQNQGQAPGPGQIPGQGSAGSGGGTRADSLPPATGSGTASQPRGQSPLTEAQKLQSQVFVPVEKLAGANELSISGQQTGQGETQVIQKPELLPGVTGKVLTPYNQVFYTYLSAANQAVERSLIPDGLKDYVRLYFSQLQP